MGKEQWILLGIGWLAVLMHSLSKMDSLSKDAHVANIDFNWWRDYVKRDLFGLILSMLCPIAWLTFAPEILKHYPKYGDFPRLAIFTVGLIGSYILQMWLGKSKAMIRRVIDQKTDIADQETAKPITNLNQVTPTKP